MPEPRGRTVPIEDWWASAVRREIARSDDHHRVEIVDDDQGTIRQEVEKITDSFTTRRDTRGPIVEVIVRAQKDLAAATRMAESQISRCLKQKGDPKQQAVLEVVIAISDALKLPYPVLFPENEKIAVHLATQHRLARIDQGLESLAGVPSADEKRQTVDVQTGDVPKKSKRKRRRTGLRAG